MTIDIFSAVSNKTCKYSVLIKVAIKCTEQSGNKVC